VIYIKKLNIPADSLINKSFDRIDYQDAYMVEETFNKKLSPEDVVKSVFKISPFWVTWLMYLRNIIVKPFGLITGNSEMINTKIDSFKGEIGDSISFFKIYDRSKNEIILGADDKHLNGRLSIILKHNQRKYQIMLITSVCFNYWLGNIYFFFIKPFHKIVMRACLKRMVIYLKK
jgi:hypothetical protein